eukprot:scaffold1504_cov34-Tisochrysis_lutea.AAC.5
MLDVASAMASHSCIAKHALAYRRRKALITPSIPDASSGSMRTGSSAVDGKATALDLDRPSSPRRDRPRAILPPARLGRVKSESRASSTAKWATVRAGATRSGGGPAPVARPSPIESAAIPCGLSKMVCRRGCRAPSAMEAACARSARSVSPNAPEAPRRRTRLTPKSRSRTSSCGSFAAHPSYTKMRSGA